MTMFDKSDDRFEIVYKQNGFGRFLHVLKDRNTGVLYLFTAHGNYGGGLCPLVDRDGRPLSEQS